MGSAEAHEAGTTDGRAMRTDRFRALFTSELAWMWTTLRRLGVKAPDLEDVTHEVFLAV